MINFVFKLLSLGKSKIMITLKLLFSFAVLPYWFTAAHKGVLGSSGNTLLHIDAHADTGLPAEVPGFSQFITPQSASQIQLLMQRNDVFILVWK